MGAERRTVRIYFRCGFMNRHGIQCGGDATHEVLTNGDTAANQKSLGKFCPVHADVVERDGHDEFFFAVAADRNG